MRAGIITIGDELLLGQTINTNLAKIGRTLGLIGINVIQSATITDNPNEITNTLDYFLDKLDVDLVIITGGLGPTKDDLTKETLTDYFETELVLDEKVLENVIRILKAKGKELLPSNKSQARVPKSCKVIENKLGTAPGMWFEKSDKNVISLPGVPYELEALMDTEVVPRLKEKFSLNSKYYQVLMVQGIFESVLAQKIENWENRILNDGLHLAYLPTPGLIRLRITSNRGEQDAKLIDTYCNELLEKYPEYVYTKGELSIFEVVGNLLRNRKKTLGTIESCTGGGIASGFIAFPGTSDFFMGGLVTYSNPLKMNLADVSESTLEKYGAVSEEVAKEMAVGGRKRLNTDYTIAVTGIAGPDGGSDEKPVGTVWIAVASKEKVVAKQFLFGSNRARNIEMTKMSAVNMLRRELQGISK